MVALLCFLLTLLASPFKSKTRLEAENAVLRRQLIILRRKVRGRVHFTNKDRFFLVQLYRWFPSVLKTITIVQLETLVRWHRAGFRRYWRWKSGSLGGRPQVDADLRALGSPSARAAWPTSMESPMLPGCTSIAMVAAFGASSRRSSSRFGPSTVVKKVTPVTLASGRAR